MNVNKKNVLSEIKKQDNIIFSNNITNVLPIADIYSRFPTTVLSGISLLLRHEYLPKNANRR